MNTSVKRIGFGALLLAGFFPLWAQNSPKGHWSGSVDVPNQSLAMEIDLDQTADGWIGSISIPAQNASGLPLEPITFEKGKCVFHIKDGPGDPTFTGALSADGQTLSGDFTQGPGTFPFHFRRTGDPKVEAPKSSPAVAKEFLGTWEGTLEAQQSLRLVLKMSNDDRGAKATLVSVDQGNVEIPVTTVKQDGTKLTLEVNMVGGVYEAELNKELSELNGTWTQGGDGLPLKLKKSTPAKEH
jgi:hypothetical protein